MYDQIYQNIVNLAKLHMSPFTAISYGSMPPDNGLAMFIGSGAPGERDLVRGGTYELSIVLNGKHGNQQTVLASLSNIHKNLTQMPEYPKTDDWQITDIESSAPPNWVGQENSTKQWLYGSIIRVTFYVKGVS